MADEASRCFVFTLIEWQRVWHKPQPTHLSAKTTGAEKPEPSIGRPVSSNFGCQSLAYASTSGNDRTSATNFASNEEELSFRQMSAKGSGNFKSATGSKITLPGHRQRVALLTNATPSPHDTRLRIVASFTPS